MVLKKKSGASSASIFFFYFQFSAQHSQVMVHTQSNQPGVSLKTFLSKDS